MKLYLVRHAQRDFGIHFDRLLTQGIWQAKKLGPVFKNKKIDIIYCSPQNRAKETLKEITPYIKGKPKIKFTQQVRQQSALEEVGADVVKRLKIKNESDEEAIERAKKFIKFLIKDNNNDNVLVISHKMFIKFVCLNLLNKPKDHFNIKSASITSFEIDKNGKIKSYKIGDLKHYSEKQTKLILDSYLFAREAHKGQKIGDGRDYIEHPAEVGKTLAKWGQDYDAICAGLLHDVIEDCEVSLDTIKRIFGEQIAFYVDGMSWFRTWNIKEKAYRKNMPLHYKKFCDYCIINENLVIIKASDEMSKTKKSKNLKIESKGEIKAKTFWIPFFREVGLEKVAKHLEWKYEGVIKRKIKVTLHNYISKKDLKSIETKLNKIKGIEELK